MMARRNLLLGALTCVILCSAGTSAMGVESHLLLADFETSPSVWITGEGLSPASSVSLSREQAMQGRWAVKLDCTFEKRESGLNYAGFGTEGGFLGRPTELRLGVYGDGSSQPLRLRLRDATGETFQYAAPDIGWTGWQEVTVPLKEAQVSWGGNDDKTWDLPVSLDSVLVDSAKEPYHGVLYFDEITYLAEETAARWVRVRVQTDAFGGVYFGGDSLPSPLVFTDNLCLDGGVSGRLSVTVTGPRGEPLFAQDAGLELPPRASQWLAVRVPERTEGLCRLEATVRVGETAETVSRSFATFAAPHPAGLMPESWLGACTHFGQGKGDVPRSFDLMSRAGIKWLRDEISWGACEREKGKIVIPEWADRYMRAAVEHGVTPLIIFDYGNALYDEGNAPTSPEAQEAFGRYCYALVDHFKDICKHWEVYNEPNIGFWRPKPDPEAYARLMRVAYAAAKSADPSCTVVGVCTAGTDLGFIESVLKSGGMQAMDALSIHPYRYPGSPEGTGFVAEVTRAHELMERYGGKEKKLWLTEIGWPTQDDARGVSEQTSGNYLVRMCVLARTVPFIERIFWYDFQDDGLDRTYNEHNFGLIRWESFSPKAGYVACKVLADHLGGGQFSRKLHPTGEEDTRHCYEFEAADGPVLVAWSAEGSGTLALALEAEEVSLTWADAHREVQRPVDGRLTLALTDMPVFIRGWSGEARIAEACMSVAASPQPVGPGERFAVKVTAPSGSRVRLSYDPAAPIKAREPEKGEVSENTFHFTVSRQAAAQAVPFVATAVDGEGKLLASAGGTAEILEPLQITLGAPTGYGATSIVLPVRLRNLRPTVLKQVRVSIQSSGGMEVDKSEERLDFSPGETHWLPLTGRFAAPGQIPGRTADLELRAKTLSGSEACAKFEVGGFRVPRAERVPRIDGSASDWPLGGAVPLGGEGSRFRYLRRGSWEGADDLRATVCLQWDEKALYFLARVTDDKHVQPEHGSAVWQGDSIQLAFDRQFEGWKARVDGREATYPELGLSLTDSGEEVYRWLWREKAVVGAAFRARREGDTVTYEASIPWEELGTGAPASGDIGGFALVINENDGDGRDGWLELYDGIGYSKDPSRFGVIRFEG